MNQSESGTEKSERKTNNKPQTNDAREQTAIGCLYSDIHTRSESNNPNTPQLQWRQKRLKKLKQHTNQMK